MPSKRKKTDRAAAIQTLDKISRSRPHPNHLWALILDAEDSLFLEQVDAGVPHSKLAVALLSYSHTQSIPDATFAITISSAVDQALELAISTHFVVDDEASQRMFDDNQNGPLGTFAAKIRMGYALGIYPTPMREELDLLRVIRNAFAHSKEKLEFASSAIAAGCAALRIPDLVVPDYEQKRRVSPKGRFLASARYLYVYLEYHNNQQPMRFDSHPMRGILSRLIP